MVLMKTDIAGSTPRFRALLSADRQALLSEHQAFVARHAADLNGQIVNPADDGSWLDLSFAGCQIDNQHAGGAQVSAAQQG